MNRVTHNRSRRYDTRLRLIACRLLRWNNPSKRGHSLLRLAPRQQMGVGGWLRFGGFHSIAMTKSPTRSHTQLRSFIASDASEPSSLPSIHATQATHDSAVSAPVRSLQQAALMALSKGVGENCCWIFARAVKAFEFDTKSRLDSVDALNGAFAVWWAAAKPSLPADANFDEYRDDFVMCYKKVKTPLGHSTIENAAALSSKRIIPSESEKYGENKAKLIALCRELQRTVGDGAFFLSVRDAAKVMGTKDLFAARNALGVLVEIGFLTMESKGTLSGRQATRYQFNELP